MDVFECGRCGVALTAPVSRVAFPVYARSTYGNGHAMARFEELRDALTLIPGVAQGPGSGRGDR